MPSALSLVLFSMALAAAAADDCTTTQLLNITSDSNTATCTSETGISITSLSSLTTAEISSVCNNTACMTLLDDVAAMGLGDCTIPGTNVSVQTDILDVVASVCSGSNSTTASSTSGTTVGDSSASSTSSTSSNAAGSATTSSTSGATTVVVGCVSMIAAVLAIALL